MNTRSRRSECRPSSYLLKPVDLATLKHVVDEIEIVKKQEALQNNKLFTLDIIRSFSMADMLGTDEMSYLPYGERNWTIYQIYNRQPGKGASVYAEA